MSKKKEICLLLLVLALAVFFRFYRITEIPPGLYTDEAANGNDARAALQSHFAVFYPDNNGREGLFINCVALSFRLFGFHIWSMRIVSAFFGVLTVLGLYLFTRLWSDWRHAILASFFLAISFWHVNFSRIAFSAITAPCAFVWSLYFLFRGLKYASLTEIVLSGFFTGLGFYTYSAFRIMPLVMILALLMFSNNMDRGGKTPNSPKMIAVVWIIATVVTIFPLLLYIYSHPSAFFQRMQQVSLLQTPNPFFHFLGNMKKTALMFHVAGDSNWRHNISGRPLLFVPAGILFAAGFLRNCLALFFKSKRHSAGIPVVLLSWFAIGLFPVVLSTERLPHALRSIMVVPVVCIFIAEGLIWLFEYVSRFQRKTATVSVMVLLLIVFTLIEYHRYFIEWGRNENVAAAFRAEQVRLAQKLNQMPVSQKKYVVVYKSRVLLNGTPWRGQTIVFLTDTADAAGQDAKNIHYLTEEQYLTRQYPPDAELYFVTE